MTSLNRSSELRPKAGRYHSAVEIIAYTQGSTTSGLSGDGDPVKESGYDSFMIKGQNDDLFFCELHDDGKYRIKAALGGNYPFRYIDEGKL